MTLLIFQILLQNYNLMFVLLKRFIRQGLFLVNLSLLNLCVVIVINLHMEVLRWELVLYCISYLLWFILKPLVDSQKSLKFHIICRVVVAF